MQTILGDNKSSVKDLIILTKYELSVKPSYTCHELFENLYSMEK
jgi:hypothetical protein